MCAVYADLTCVSLVCLDQPSVGLGFVEDPVFIDLVYVDLVCIDLENVDLVYVYQLCVDLVYIYT